MKATPALVKCQEDDEFVTAFEKMMTDDLQTRKIENLKVPTLDVAVPMHLKGPGSDKSMYDTVCSIVCACICSGVSHGHGHVANSLRPHVVQCLS